MVSFDFPEICVALANSLTPTTDVGLFMPEVVVRPLQPDLHPGVHLETFKKPRLRQPVQQLAMCRDIVRALRRFKPDVVHVQQGHPWFSPVLFFLRGPAVVVTIHDVIPHPGDRASMKTPQPVLNVAWTRADQVIVHAEATKQQVVERLHREPSTVHVIPHIAIGSAPEGTSPEGDGCTVLFFGRIWPYKGLDHLIRAQPRLSERVPEARIVIAGQGEDIQRYREMMSDPSRFEVINEFVSIPRRSELFARSAVVVLPYVEASQSGVVPVAYAFGKPVVVTSVGGLPEMVEDGVNGLVVEPGDEAALADAIARLLEQPDLARAMGAEGKRKLERESTPGRNAEATRRVYERAVHHAEIDASSANSTEGRGTSPSE